MSYDDGKRPRGKTLGQLSEDYLGELERELDRDLTSAAGSGGALVPQNLGHKKYVEGDGAQQATAPVTRDQPDVNAIPLHERQLLLDTYNAARENGHDKARAIKMAHDAVHKSRVELAGKIAEVAKDMRSDFDILADMMKGK